MEPNKASSSTKRIRFLPLEEADIFALLELFIIPPVLFKNSSYLKTINCQCKISQYQKNIRIIPVSGLVLLLKINTMRGIPGEEDNREREEKNRHDSRFQGRPNSYAGLRMR